MSSSNRQSPSGTPPSENTITINIVTELLTLLRGVGFQRTAVISPSRDDEADYGYDVGADWDFNFVKAFGLQFKRPAGTVLDGRFRFKMHDEDGEQLDALCDNFEGEGEAFYALPVVEDRAYLPGQLHNTVFVDAHTIHTEMNGTIGNSSVDEPSILYIKTESAQNATGTGGIPRILNSRAQDEIPQRITQPNMRVPVNDSDSWWRPVGNAPVHIRRKGSPGWGGQPLSQDQNVSRISDNSVSTEFGLIDNLRGCNNGYTFDKYANRESFTLDGMNDSTFVIIAGGYKDDVELPQY